MFVEPQHQPITTKPADPFTLPALIAWLETMPGDRAYRYGDVCRCLLGEYFTAMGFEGVVVGPESFDHSRQRNVVYPRIFDDIAVGRGSMFKNTGRSFGAALTRARKALSDQQSLAPADTVRSA